MTRPDDSFHPQQDNTTRGGISLREHFASLALSGAAFAFDDPAKAADYAVDAADALIARLNSDPAKKPASDPAEIIDLSM